MRRDKGYIVYLDEQEKIFSAYEGWDLAVRGWRGSNEAGY
jgi:hypothetical protein